MSALAETAEAVTSTTYWTATAIFLATFAAIVSEKVHKTKAALFGASMMLVLQIVTQEEAFHSPHVGIDHNVIFLLISMMILVNVLSRTGLFEWAAIRAAKAAQGRPIRIMLLFVSLTALASALLDNVTTVLLIAPVTLLIADELDIDPVPFLLVEAMASNIGGAATLIGDPPNIVIGSRAGLDFMDFLLALGPVVIVMMAALIGALFLLFRKRLHVTEERRQRVLGMDERRMIKDPALAKKAVGVLLLTLVGFTLHGTLHLEPATIALFGAATILLLAKGNPHKVLADVEWPTIFFFIGLFIVVGGIVKVGVVHDVSRAIVSATAPTQQGMQATATTLLWASGLLSAVVDNIPYVATMNPLVLDMANSVFHGGVADSASLPLATLHQPVMMPVWWSLALGACLGGNATPIGASANVVVLGVLERSGKRISFLKFMLMGVPVTLMTLLIAQLYLYLFYY
ncbi:MAG: ArsB/NhaD family transporter [Planctomycetes bacterium]|nr:ArsB/NhaD family transporter [Planctomycetota bacterium]